MTSVNIASARHGRSPVAGTVSQRRTTDWPVRCIARILRQNRFATMSRHSESRLLPYTCDQLFALVLDIERYPAFVPGYSRACILRRDEAALEVEQCTGFGPLAFTFRSRAEFETPHRISIRAGNGPFRRLDVTWLFVPQEGGCRVTAETHYELGPLLAPVLQGSLALLAPRLLDAFARRAAELYGEHR